MLSQTPIPVPASLIAECSGQMSASVRRETLLTGEDRRQLSPWAIERAMRKARSKVKDLPAGFRYHDLRHYFASLLIAYGHIWPDRAESTRPPSTLDYRLPDGTAAEQRYRRS